MVHVDVISSIWEGAPVCQLSTFLSLECPIDKSKLGLFLPWNTTDPLQEASDKLVDCRHENRGGNRSPVLKMVLRAKRTRNNRNEIIIFIIDNSDRPKIGEDRSLA